MDQQCRIHLPKASKVILRPHPCPSLQDREEQEVYKQQCLLIVTPPLQSRLANEESQEFLVCPSPEQWPCQSCPGGSHIPLGIPTHSCHFLGYLPGKHFEEYDKRGVKALARESWQMSPSDPKLQVAVESQSRGTIKDGKHL